ncbi:DUF1761 family protein [Candidatus Micrarchaeota archaeon]|nr:DUF1761 family protein [Candidatus Micrarchaeota archaeon]
MDVVQAAFAGVIASIVWFVVGGALYMNPFVAGIYKNAENSPALKKWKDTKQYIGLQYVGILLQCLLWAFVFALIKDALPGPALFKGLWFGAILVALKIIPRFYDMWIQTNYPNKLLAIEFVNGFIGSFVIGLVLAHML